MTTEYSHPLQGHGSKFWLAIAGLPLLGFLISWGLYEAIIRFTHYSIGFLLSLLVVGAGGSLFSTTFMERRLFQQDTANLPRATRNQLAVTFFFGSLSQSLTAVLLLVTLFAWISYALFQSGLAGQPDTHSAPVTYANLVSTYAWHFVDLIPGTNVQQTLGLDHPAVKFIGWIPGTPFLLFRVLIGVVAFTAFRRAWTFVTESADRLERDEAPSTATAADTR